MVEVLAGQVFQLPVCCTATGSVSSNRCYKMRELARAMRYAFDPASRVDVPRRDDRVTASNAGVALHGTWALETDHRDADVYRTDGAHHASYWV